MAVDMTDETIAQYMERIEKMSIKEIQKEHRYVPQRISESEQALNILSTFSIYQYFGKFLPKN